MAPKKEQGKDIRSFFTSISPKTPSAKAPEDDMAKRKKKALAISDSDSDDLMAPTPQVKRSKAKVEDGAKSNKGKVRKVTDPDSDDDSPFIAPKKTQPSAKVKKEEPPLKPVDIASVFGTSPIQRSKELNDKKKRKLEDQNEDDFAAPKKSKTTRSPPEDLAKTRDIETKKSPLKVEEFEASTAKKLVAKKDSPRKIKGEPIVIDDSPEKKNKARASEAKKSPSKAEEREDSPAKKSSAKKDHPKRSEKKIKSEVVYESPKKNGDETLSTESPGPDPLEKRKQRAEAYKNYLAHHKEGAKNPGCKQIPDGAAGCLEGLKFVVTGVLESLARQEAEQLIKQYGGHTTSAVSSKTTHLLAGEDAGPSKLSKAKDLKVKIISEDDLLEMIASRPAGTGCPSPAPKKTAPSTPKSAPIPRAVKSEKRSPPEPKEGPKKTEPPAKPSKEGPKKTEPPAKPSNIVAKTEEAALPWVEKYKPLAASKIIGQQTDRSNAKKLAHWLQNWHENHSGHKKLTRPAPWSTNDDGAFFKAALLSGPPGIGKTTTAHLISKELGFDVVEFNASDTRSKRLLKEEVSELISCRSLNAFAHGRTSIGNGKRVLIMDEVDGMAGNEDRGGIQELISLIKTSKVPVLCICNDRQHPKVRSLSNYCYDLKFAKPSVMQIRGAMLSICCKEGVSIRPEALDEIIIGANQDVRQVLHHLSLLSSKEKTMSTEQAKIDAQRSKKDFKLGPWDVCRKVFSAEEHRTMSLHDKTGLFFQDYSFGPLFVQENYLLVRPQAAKNNNIKVLDLVARTADCLSQTDLIEKVIRSCNAWSLLPVEAVFASVVPGQLMEGVFTGQIQFPTWLGKNSRQNKMDRLLQELQLHTRLKVSASKRALNLDYLPHILGAVVAPLQRRGTEGVDDAVRAMEGYDLMREDLDSLLELNQWPNKIDPMKAIEAKVKTAFTRAYNKEVHLPYASTLKVTKGRAKGGADDEALDLDDAEGADGGESDVEEDDVSADAMIKVKKTAAKVATAKAEKAGPSGGASRGARGGRGGRGGRGKATK